MKLRIRHGIIHDPILGYRAIRDTDGHREWIGPWRTTDHAAQEDADAAKTALHTAVAQVGGRTVDKPNPDIGHWQPDTGPAR